MTSFLLTLLSSPRSSSAPYICILIYSSSLYCFDVIYTDFNHRGGIMAVDIILLDIISE